MTESDTETQSLHKGETPQNSAGPCVLKAQIFLLLMYTSLYKMYTIPLV